MPLADHQELVDAPAERVWAMIGNAVAYAKTMAEASTN